MKILFYIRKSKINSRNLCPLTCRITLNNSRKEFSPGLFTNPDNWNASKQKAFPPNTDNTQLNTQLSLIKQEINQAFLMLQVQRETFDVEDIYLQYKGEAVKSAKSLLEVYTLHNDRMKKLVGVEYSNSTLKKFEESKNHVKSFIRSNYEKSNILLEQLNMKFLNDFDYFLKVEKKLKQVTINKHIERLRKIIKLGMAE